VFPTVQAKQVEHKKPKKREERKKIKAKCIKKKKKEENMNQAWRTKCNNYLFLE